MIPSADKEFLFNYNENTQQYIYKLFLNPRVNVEKKSLKDFIKKFVTGFDVDKMKSHNSIPVEYDGDIIHIDELLVKLFNILNNYGLITFMSCQYNGEGYAFFSFTINGFDYWIRKLSQASLYYINKQNPSLNAKECIKKAIELPIIKRFMNKTINYNNKLIFLSNWNNRFDEIKSGVQWCFLQEDIPEIISQLNCVLNE
jgi:hypothetical protein